MPNWSIPPPIEETNVFKALDQKLDQKYQFSDRLLTLELSVLEKMVEILNTIIEAKKAQQ